MKKAVVFSSVARRVLTLLQEMYQLDRYIVWMNKQKGLPMNISKLAAIDMPKGSRKM